jgi:hypothetical protein
MARFYIISELNGYAVDINGANRSAGANVIVWTCKRDKSPNQLWYLDPTGNLRSALNEFAPQSNGQGDKFTMQTFNASSQQQWTIQGNKIVNKGNPSLCLDIEGGKNEQGVNLISWPYKGSANQHWRIEYV